jgi:signal transduction histidine kinase
VDKDLFRIAINNLLTNAIKYNQPGGTVTLDARETENEIEISVRDNGIGIAPKEQAAIFDKFYRSDDEQVRAQTGHGLGLPLVQQIVQLHHAELVLESTPRKGSHFMIRLNKTSDILPYAVPA